MPVRNNLGAASITVEADIANFGKELAAKLRTALTVVDREAKAAGKRIGKQIVEGIGDEVLRQTPLLRRRINAMLRGISVTARVRVNVDVDQGRTSISGIAARIRGQLEGEALGPLKSLGNLLGSLTGGLMPKSIQQLGIMISLGSILGTVLAGAFNATGREVLNLVKLVGFLPAALGVVAAVAGTVAIATMGISDALQAVFSKDPEKLKEALASLTPSARSFVMEFQKALPVFDRIKSSVQEMFFKTISGDVTRVITNLAPALSVGLTSVANAIGYLLNQVASVLANPTTQTFLSNLFMFTTKMINSLAGPVASLVQSLLNVMNAALPSFSKLIGGDLAGFIQKVADWLNQVVADGRFQQFLDSATRTLKDVWYVVTQLALLFGVLFDDANSEGKSFLEIIGDMIADFRDFAASNTGKFALEGIMTMAKLAGLAIIGISVAIGVVIAAVGSFVAAVKRAIEWVRDLVNAIRTVSNSSGGISNAVGRTIANMPGHADGDIVKRPEIATLAEDGPEVVIPLTRPDRARKLAEQSGLTRILGGGAGTTIQKFYLGTEEVDARIVSVSSATVNDSVDDASFGTRAA